MEELEKLRKEIDKLDKMIAEIISKRQGLSNKILEAKGGEFTYDPVRERKVMEKIFSYDINSKLAERIWRQIIAFNILFESPCLLEISSAIILSSWSISFLSFPNSSIVKLK